jgi:hypothetical protein
LGSNNATVVSDSSKGLTPTPSDACTCACTSEPENVNADALDTTSLGTPPQAPDTDQGNKGEGIDQGDPLANLAAVIASLSLIDRQRLAAMLTGHQGKGEGGTA